MKSNNSALVSDDLMLYKCFQHWQIFMSFCSILWCTDSLGMSFKKHRVIINIKYFKSFQS